MPVLRRVPTQRQFHEWDALRKWEPLEQTPCSCVCNCRLCKKLRKFGGHSEAQHLINHAVKGSELVARAGKGTYTWPAQPKTRVQFPRRNRCRQTNELIRLVLEQCVERGACAVWITHPEYAELAGCGINGSRHAQAEAERPGFLEVIPAYLSGAELEHRAKLRDGQLPKTRIRKQPVKHMRAGNFIRLGPRLLDELRVRASGHTRQGLRTKAEIQADRLRKADEAAKKLEQFQYYELPPSWFPVQKGQATEEILPPRDLSGSGSGANPESNRAASRRSVRSPAAPEIVDAPSRTSSRRARSPSARADKLSAGETPTEPASPALMGVSLPSESAPVREKHASGVPHVRAVEREEPDEYSSGPSSPDCAAAFLACDDFPSTFDAASSPEELLELGARPSQLAEWFRRRRPAMTPAQIRAAVAAQFLSVE